MCVRSFESGGFKTEICVKGEIVKKKKKFHALDVIITHVILSILWLYLRDNTAEN